MYRTERKTLAIILALTLTACGGERKNDELTVSEGSLQKALQEMTEQNILPAVDNFYAESQALTSSAETFCASVNETNLLAVQSHWQATHSSWGKLSLYNFGPLDDDVVFPPFQYIDSFRLRGTDYTETVRNTLASWVDGDATLDPDFFSAKAFNLVGLLAIEVTAFETLDTQSQITADIVSEFSATDRKCNALTGLSAALEKQAKHIYDGWHTEYLETGTSFTDMLLNNELADGTDSLTALITTVQQYFDFMTNRSTVINVAQLSGNNWVYASAGIAEVRQLLSGTGNTAVSLFALMKTSGNAGNVETVIENLNTADEAISDQDATTFNAAAALLDGNFKREIPDSLDVSLGINFSDGD